MRRRLLLLLGLAALLVLWGWLLLRPKPQPLGVPTRTNFERVQEGMTKEEVEAILGPEGHHAEGAVVVLTDNDTSRRQWIEYDAVITIEFFPKEATFDSPFEWRVIRKSYHQLPPESLRERLRRLVPWCERALGSS